MTAMTPPEFIQVASLPLLPVQGLSHEIPFNTQHSNYDGFVNEDVPLPSAVNGL